MMQENLKENNNFDTIISTWRRMSEEQTESGIVSMSGDHDLQFHKKKEEEASVLLPERLKGPIATAASAGAVATASADTLPHTSQHEDNLLKTDTDNNKEAAGDNNHEEDNLLKHDSEDIKVAAGDDNLDKEVVGKPGEEKSADRVDNVVFLTHQVIKVVPPPVAPGPEEEGCGMKCLYYTIMCCDCVLM